MISVQPLVPGLQQQWDEFVLAHPCGSPFHLIAWKKTIEETFPYRPIYLLASDSDRIRGVLPLFLVENLLIGKALISSPFAVYGGILADSEPVRGQLYDAASKLGEEIAVGYMELRNAYREQCSNAANVDRYFGFTQEVTPDEQCLMASLPKKTRNLVRKSLKQPFLMQHGVVDLTHFYELLSVSFRRLGTPMFPRSYFERLIRHFREMVDVREVWLGNRVMAVSLNLLFRDTMHIYYAAADTRYNALGPNTFMYYDHLRWAGQNGYRSFDFGRSKPGTGPFEFKRHWNTTMRQLPYEIALIKSHGLPNHSPTSRNFRPAIAIWRQLPLSVTMRVGPRLIGLFP